MSDKPNGILSKEQIEAVSGGDGECTPLQWIEATRELTAAYESLVDFTSHVFDRVFGQ